MEPEGELNEQYTVGVIPNYIDTDTVLRKTGSQNITLKVTAGHTHTNITCRSLNIH